MSTPHIADDLPLLLSGEAGRDAVIAAADHLRSCPDCQQELVSAVVAHASLSSAHRFAPDVVTSTDHAPVDEAEYQPLPDLEQMFAQVREEAALEAAMPTQRRRHLAIAVAAAAVVAAGGTAVAVVASGSSSPASRSIAMVVNDSNVRPTATLTGTTLKLDASALPSLSNGYQYEVWLTRGRGRPQSVGFVDADRRAALTVPSDLLSQYDGIAVSKQAARQTAYSGDTVMYSEPGQKLD